MEDPELALFEDFLMLPDPDLHNWIMGDQTPVVPHFANLVAELRMFHGLSKCAD